MRVGFDNERYKIAQGEKILERVNRFGNKLYLEFGGKLFNDLHAARVLPGFDPDVKINILETLKEKAEIICCIRASDIEKNKIRGDMGISYTGELLRLVDRIRKYGLQVKNIVITQYENQPAADMFKKKLERRGERVYLHYHTKGYPTDVDTIVSDEGYGKNAYIETTMPLVVVTAPGPGSGKLATCLNQLYHEYKRGIKSGYAKFETFPVWNLPLSHPVNIAYEAAAADIKDVNMIDSFHLEAYGETVVNYNRDLEVFPVLRTILAKIMDGENVYQSPTDMGVNVIKSCITDDEACREAGRTELIRRYYQYARDYREGRGEADTVSRMEFLMSNMGLKTTERPVIAAALAKESLCRTLAIALELPDKTIVTGRNTALLRASASVILNAVKHLAGIPDVIDIISPKMIKPISALKNEILKEEDYLLDLSDMLLALTLSATVDENAKKAVRYLNELGSLEAHSTAILTGSEYDTFRKLGIRITSEPSYDSDNLYFE